MAIRTCWLQLGLCGTLVVAAAGCGGGGSGGPSPLVTPTPAVTSTPTAAPTGVNSRPIASGDTFAYAGSTQTADVFTGATPYPRSTNVVSVVQQVAVSGPAALPAAFGPANAFDFRTLETDTSPLQKIGVTTNTYYTMSGADLLTYGYTSLDTNGEQLTVAYANVGSGNGLVDVLPERPGQAWTNTNAQTLSEVSVPAQQSATRRYTSDGAYVDNATYAATGFSTTIAEAADGSGSYTFSFSGASFAIALSAPQVSGSSHVVSIDQTGVPTQTVAVWYPLPLVLYSEKDVNNGPATIPSACAVPAKFGTTGNALVQSYRRVDTILGTLENFTQTNYVVPVYGVACVVLSDSIDSYYDYSGQSAPFPVFGSVALENQTVSSTLGLTAGETTAAASAPGLRIANARAAFFSALEREKQRRMQLAVRHVLSVMKRGRP